MGENTSRAKVMVALVGVGPTWELHYREAIERLSSKLTVRAVCDSVQMRAAVVADEYEASVVACPWQLTQRTDLHAWIILDPGWFDTYPADLAVRSGRPALLASTFSLSIPRLTGILRRSLDQGETLMPEFPQRYTAATNRLRELMVTRLGRVRRIVVTVPRPVSDPASVAEWLEEDPSYAISLFDWCACLIGDCSTGATFAVTPTGAQLQLHFPSKTSRPDDAPHVILRFHAAETCLRHIECERGAATITSPTQIAWQTSDEYGQETLIHERSPHEIILDQFCRRALGGLVPVPTLNHALQAIAMSQFALESLKKS